MDGYTHRFCSVGYMYDNSILVEVGGMVGSKASELVIVSIDVFGIDILNGLCIL